MCSDSYTTKHLVRGTLRPDETADNLPYEKVGKNEPMCIADEVPFDIPESWEWVRISGVFSVINGDRGKNYPAKSTLSNTGIPFISAVNLDGKTVIEDDNLLCLSDEQFNKLGSGKLEKDDVVVCIRGSLGKHGRYPFEKGAIASSLVILRPHLNIPLLSDFIMMYLDSPLFFSEIKRYNNGTAQPNLAAKSLEMFFLPLPPLPEQKRIVEKLNEVSSLTDNYAEAYVRVAELNQKFPELLKKSILQEAVQGKLVPQDPNDEPASVLLERIRAEKQALIKAGKIKKDKNESVIFRRDNSHYEKLNGIERCIDDEIPFEIPNNWCWVRLGTISTYAQKKEKINAKNASPNIWKLDLEDIEKGGKLLKKSNVSERKAVGDKTIFYKGNILYSKLRPYLLKIFVADENGICTPEIVPFDTYCNIYNEYIATYLKSPYVDNFINTITYGVKMPRVGTETMVDLFVPLPPVEEQHRIVATYKSILPALEQL